MLKLVASQTAVELHERRIKRTRDFSTMIDIAMDLGDWDAVKKYIAEGAKKKAQLKET